MTRRKKPNTSSQQPAPVQQPTSAKSRWYKADLHVHTPASRDYEEPSVSYLDWLRKVVERGLDIVAITDHNTVAGVGAIRRELEWLTRLEQQGRLNPEEQQRLDEWRALGDKVMVLPGFEFTATFGFHILAIFPPETSLRHLEHVLLDLKVPPGKLDEGSTETGATTDVLGAYRSIRAAGGLVIAAHANSTHGVAMRNFPFGGQTKIAYTQDPNLDALEVTDLDRSGRSTARFYNGTKPEYPRRMHCLQGSDAHRLTMDPKNPKRLGVGERATELLLDEPTYDALANVLRSKQFERVRPARPVDTLFDPLDVVREEGPTLVQSFHETATERGGKLAAILADVCAFANTAGGAVYVGCKPGKGKIKGLLAPTQTDQELRTALDTRFTPPLEVKIETVQSQNAKVLRLQVPKGIDLPYALDDNKIYVRDETETSLAVRDEIVALVKEALGFEQTETEGEGEATHGAPIVAIAGDAVPIAPMIPDEPTGAPGERDEGRSKRSSRRRPGRGKGPEAATPSAPQKPAPESRSQAVSPANNTTDGSADGSADTTFYLPQVGVEIVSSEERNGLFYHTIRDMRNGHVVHNVTRKGARKLWSYAIAQHEDHPLDATKVEWQGPIGMAHAEKRAGKVRYDLVLREGAALRIFYGVTEDGMDGAWAVFLGDE